MNTETSTIPTVNLVSAPLAAPTVLRVVHSLQREQRPTPAQQPRVELPREMLAPRLPAFELDYLNWYYGDPLKRSLSMAHTHSSNHRSEVLNSQRCGCFHCGSIFAPKSITTWVRDAEDDTAFCPDCDIDAVIGDASGYPVTPEFLATMKKAWFGMD